MKIKIIGIFICILLILSTTTLALTHFSKNTEQTKNQFVDTTPIPLPTSGRWMKTFGGNSSDTGHSVRQTSDGGYIVVGSTFSFGAGQADFWVIKTDSNGNKLWDKTFGGLYWDIPTDVKLTNDKGFIITGRTHSFGAGNIDVWVIKLDETGNVQWNKTYGTQFYEGGFESQQTTDGGYIIIGSRSLTQFEYFDALLIKIDSNGNEQWNKTYGGIMDDYGYEAYQTSDGGYIMIGTTSSYGAGDEDAWMIKTDAYGDELWNKTYGGKSGDTGYSFNQTMDGGYIITGYTASFGKDAYSGDLWLFKTDSQGKSKTTSSGNLWFERLFQRFPNAFPILQKLLGY